MSSERPKAESQAEIVAARNTETDAVTAGVVSEMRNQFEPSPLANTARAKLQAAENLVQTAQEKKAVYLRKRATAITVAKVVGNIASAALGAVTGHVGSIASGIYGVGKAAKEASKDQQKAIRNSIVLTREHINAVADEGGLYDKSFTTEQKESFSEIIDKYYNEAPLKNLLGHINQMDDPTKPTPLKVEKIQEFLNSSAIGREALEKSVSEALNDKKNPELAEARQALALVTTDSKARIAMLVKIFEENARKQASKPPPLPVSKANFKSSTSTTRSH